MKNPLHPLVASLKSVLPLALCAGLLLMQATPLAAATITAITNFNASLGSDSRSDLVLGPDGLLYGATQLGGGVSTTGVVFKVTTSGVTTPLVSFTGPGGSQPQGGFAFAPDGQFYGIAYRGGPNGYGTVWRANTNGGGTALASFDAANGAFPIGGVTRASDGNFYGTTFSGFFGNSFGCVFKLTPGGVMSTLASISNAPPNGKYPYARVTQAGDGHLYGVTHQGGTAELGAVFRVTLGGALTTLASFTGANGSTPLGGLTLGTDGNLYGVTQLGGGNNLGTVFKVTTGGVLTNLASFLNATTDGSQPVSALVQGADGNFYGTTTSGGASGDGTVFRITPAGVLTRLASFSYTATGASPWGKMAFGLDGNLYGTTQYGGSSNRGTIYRVSGLAPSVITQPGGASIATGANVAMSVTVFGSPPFTYQWRFNGTPIGGATSNSLALTNVSAAQQGGYTVVVANGSGSVTSLVAVLTVDTTYNDGFQELVTVGNPGNSNDVTTGFGAVPYLYSLGKYEVTLNQYAVFLNAVAAADPNGLYNPTLATDQNSRGISRSGSPGSYFYMVNSVGTFPVTYVSWFDAARFANWLHNGRPSGAQSAATTEDGAYTLNGATNGVGFAKNLGARYWIPSENEWYKAAYHQPSGAGGDSDDYWLYPTRSNTIPNSRNGSSTDANSGNFVRDDGIANGFNGGFAVSQVTGYSSIQNYLTEVYAFTLARSFYSTLGQVGSVWEWNDATVFGSQRGLRGGSWLNDELNIRASDRLSGDPALEYPHIGLRIAAAAPPDISIAQAATDIPDGGSSDFGSVAVGASGAAVTFTIRNTGLGDLTGLAFTKDGANAGDFTISAAGTNTVAPGSNTTFTVTFTPGGTDFRTCVLHCANNDPEENPFDIRLTGFGSSPAPLALAQQAYAKPSNTGVTDNFGYAVAVSGDTVVVTAYQEDSSAAGVNGNEADNGANNSGAAYIFVRSGSNWTQQAYLKASNPGVDDIFGVSVAISGDTVVVGANGEDSNAAGVNGNQVDNSAVNAGAAYVFVRNGGVWTQQAYLKASNPGAGDSFGLSVAVSGDTAVVGAFFEDSDATGINGSQNDNSFEAGAAYVFVRSGSNWSQQAYLKASNTGANDQFGQTVAISGDTVVVGAYGEDSNATGINGNQADNSTAFAGAAYVFVRSGGVWSQQAYLKASTTGVEDLFGAALAVSGDTVVVGAYGEASNATGVNGNQADNSAPYSGAAYVFVRDGTNWSQQAYLKASNSEGTGTLSDVFGVSVAVSGDTVVVGASGEDSSATGINGNQADNSASQAGAAYVFVRGGGVWIQQSYLKSSNTGTNDNFGLRVAVSGGTVVVAALFEDSNATGINGNQADNSATDSGAVYIFNSVPPNPAITLQPVSQTVCPIGSASFTASASGAPSLVYQWSFNGTNLANATNATLTLSNLSPAILGGYAVVITNNYGSVTSSIATLAFGDFVAPTIVCPANLTVNCDPNNTFTTVTYAVSASDACDPAPVVVCAPPSGIGFRPGTTTVTCLATDAGGNTNGCAFTVTVQNPAHSDKIIVSMYGGGGNGYFISSSQLPGVSWTQQRTYANATITANIVGGAGNTGIAYLTTQRGAGTTSGAHEVARNLFTFPASAVDFPLFTGLLLPPGTYHLTLASVGTDTGNLWWTSLPPLSTNDVGANLNSDQFFNGVIDPYPPASPSGPFGSNLRYAVKGTEVLAGQLWAHDVVVNELAGNAVFRVVLPVAQANTVTVAYQTADGTARAGTDYTATSGVLTFAPGQTNRTVTVPLFNNGSSEPSEYFFLNLSNPVNATLARAQAAATIVDDDAPSVAFPGVWLAPAANATNNLGQPIPLTLRFDNPPVAFLDTFSVLDGASLIPFDRATWNFGEGSGFPTFDLTVPWTPASAGLHSVRAVISYFDASANYLTATSAPVALNVTAPPAQGILSILSFNSNWRYDASTLDFGTAWKETNYNDAAWSGPSPGVFYNETATLPEVKNTFLPLTNAAGARIRGFYFRTEFVFPTSPVGATLIASNLIDDGAVFYLNGTEVGRLRMTNNPVVRTSLATNTPPFPGGDATNYETLTYSAAALRQGTNTLAVEVHQVNDGSSDIVFGLRLDAIPGSAPTFTDATQPTNRTVLQNRSSTFTAAVNGAAPLTWRWIKGSSTLISTSTNSPDYVITNMTGALAGSYRCVVSNSFGSITSRTATVSYTPDEDGPVLLSATGATNLAVVFATFNELLDPVTATNLANYILIPATGGPVLPILNASVSGATVALVTAPRLACVNYLLFVSNAANLADLAGNIAPPVGQPVASTVVVLAADNHVWRYFQSNVDPGAGWSSPGFLDTAEWCSGPAPFDAKRPAGRVLVGPGNLPVRTMLNLTNPPGASEITRTFYFRTTFRLPGPPVAGTRLLLRSLVDDGAIFYLNGLEVRRQRMPAVPAPIGYLDFATGTANDNDNVFEGPFDLPTSALVAGDNVLAVEVHQANAGSSDLTFAAELSAVLPAYNSAPPTITCPGNIVTACNPTNFTTVPYGVTATDACGSPLPVTCVPPSGSAFLPAVTPVNCVKTDTSGRSNTCSFTVTVRAETAIVQPWAQRFNGTGNGNDEVRGVVVDGDGNVIVTGYARGIGSERDFYTVKYAATNGAVLWTNRYNGPANGDDVARAMALDASGNVIVTGYSEGVGTGLDCFTVKYAAADGAVVWTNRYIGTGNSTEDPYAVAVDASGNVIVTGVSFNVDYFTIKYAAVNGAVVWEKRYNGPGNGIDVANAMALDVSGNVLVTGYSDGGGSGLDYFTVKYAAADGGVLWTNRYNGTGNGDDYPEALAVDASGNVVVAGYSRSGGVSFDRYTAKYAAATGARLWENRYQGPDSVHVLSKSVAVDAAGNVVVTGDYIYLVGADVRYDVHTAKYAAATGVQLWEKRYNGPANGFDQGRAVAVEASGNVVVTMNSDGIGSGWDIYTARYAAVDGALLWEARYNGPANGNDAPDKLALAPGGTIVLAGLSDSDFTTATNYDGVVVVYRPLADTFAPIITCPTNRVVACAGPSGTPVTFSATAVDNCDSNVMVVCVPPSGFAFPLGTNLVTCTATDAAGNTNACSFTITVLDNATLPLLAAPPQSRTNVIGTTATFTALVANCAPLSYQWRKGGVAMTNSPDIFGVNSPTLVLARTTLAGSPGGYSVVLSNSFGSITSTVATLAIVAPQLQPVGIPITQDGWVGSFPTNSSIVLGGGTNGQLNIATPNAATLLQYMRKAYFGAEITNGLGLSVAFLRTNFVHLAYLSVKLGTNIDASYNGSGFIRFYAVPQDNPGRINPLLAGDNRFAETTLAWTNAPGNREGDVVYAANTINGVVLAEVPVPNPARNADITISSQALLEYVQASTNGFFTIAAVYVGENNTGYNPEPAQGLAFRSRESGVTSIIGLNTAPTPLPATIARQPQPFTLYAGGTANFSVGAAGSPPFTYQWSRNGTALPGATNAVLTVSNVQPADTGAYSVEVCNAGARVGSSNATLQLLAPTIPGGYEAFVGTTTPLCYWRFSEATGGTVITNRGTLGAAANGTVVPLPPVPGITLGAVGARPPAFGGFEANNTAGYFDGANGYISAPALNLNTNTGTFVAWVKRNGTQSDTAHILSMRRSGSSDNAGLHFDNSPNRDHLRYTWADTSSSYSWDSGLIVPDGEWTLVALVVQSTQAVMYCGTSIGLGRATNTIPHFTAGFGGPVNIGRDPAFSTRYFKGCLDEVAIYSRALSPAEIEGLYAARLTPQPPLITSQPQPVQMRVPPDPQATPLPGTNFMVTASGAPPLRYQWQFNGVNLPGATGSILTLTNIQLSNEGDYRCAVSNDVGGTFSDAARLFALITPVIVEAPWSQSVVERSLVTVRAVITGHPAPFGFFWRSNTVTPIGSFVTNDKTNVFTFNAGAMPAAGSPSTTYRLVVTNMAALSPGVSTTFVITRLSDWDQDGLPDAYETALGLSTNNPTDALLDLDGDGMTTLNEYLAGTNPQDQNSYLRIDQVSMPGMSIVQVAAVSNRTYTVQFKDDLASPNWSKLVDLIARPTNRVELIKDLNPSNHRIYRLALPMQP